MSQELLPIESPSVSLVVMDEEPCVLDLDIAARLGIARPRDIRGHIIDPHREEFEAFGILRARRANSGRRGRPSTEYLLNQNQALLACILSRTEKSRQVRYDVIKAYSAYQQQSADRAMVVVETPAKDRLSQFVDVIVPKVKDAVASSVNGYTKKWVSPVLDRIGGSLTSLRSYTEERFEAMHKRDSEHRSITEDVADAVAAVRVEVQEIKVFLTRKVEVPVEDTKKFLTIAQVQDLVELPVDCRSRGMASALSHSARTWFEKNGRSMRVMAMSRGKPRYLFNEQDVPEWWQAAGRDAGRRYYKGAA